MSASSETAEKLQDYLNTWCHGSGLDCAWDVTETDAGYVLRMGFHCMDEHGFYDGWCSFQVDAILTLADFELTFTTEDSSELDERYLLRDYLEETIADAFRGFLERKTLGGQPIDEDNRVIR